MRRSRIAIIPLPLRKGLLFHGVLFRGLAAALVIAAGFATTGAHAAGNVGVTLRISTLTYANADKSCAVSVPAGSNGIAVLSAATASHCISGYTLQSFTGGHFLDCVDDGVNGNRCGDPAPSYLRYWAMRLQCTATAYGVDDYKAVAGDELTFSYEVSWAYGVPTPQADGRVCG